MARGARSCPSGMCHVGFQRPWVDVGWSGWFVSLSSEKVKFSLDRLSMFVSFWFHNHQTIIWWTNRKAEGGKQERRKWHQERHSKVDTVPRYTCKETKQESKESEMNPKQIVPNAKFNGDVCASNLWFYNILHVLQGPVFGFWGDSKGRHDIDIVSASGRRSFKMYHPSRSAELPMAIPGLDREPKNNCSKAIMDFLCIPNCKGMEIEWDRYSWLDYDIPLLVVTAIFHDWPIPLLAIFDALAEATCITRDLDGCSTYLPLSWSQHLSATVPKWIIRMEKRKPLNFFEALFQGIHTYGRPASCKCSQSIHRNCLENWKWFSSASIFKSHTCRLKVRETFMIE
jgi:hypothetical protein